MILLDQNSNGDVMAYADAQYFAVISALPGTTEFCNKNDCDADRGFFTD